MKRKVTIVMVTSTPMEDIHAALSLIDEATSYRLTSRPVRPDDELGVLDEQPAPVLPDKTGKDSPRADWRHGDQRLVWDSLRNRIAVDATLKKMGLTRDELEKMPTKRGTLENAVKASMSRQAP